MTPSIATAGGSGCTHIGYHQTSALAPEGTPALDHPWYNPPCPCGVSWQGSRTASPTGTILEQGHPWGDPSRPHPVPCPQGQHMAEPSTQAHCQPFLQGGRGAARESHQPQRSLSHSTQQPKGSRAHSNWFHMSNSIQPTLLLCPGQFSATSVPQLRPHPPATWPFFIPFCTPKKASSALALSGRARFGPRALFPTQRDTDNCRFEMTA